MTNSNRELVLTAFMLPAGYYKDSWRMTGSQSEALGSLELAKYVAELCEAACLDAVFIGDIPSAQATVLKGDIMMAPFYEPITTLSALAALTSNIGLIGTMSTTYSTPFNAARQLSGLDTLSGGRAGWNIVTSWAGSANFGISELASPEERYRRANEFVETAIELWDSWSDDAVTNDKAAGVWADPSLIRTIHHAGEFFSVTGPLPMRRSPQGRPLLVQAGSSSDGMDLGSRFADLIYTAQPDRAKAIDFYSAYKRQVAEAGRAPGDVKILPGLVPLVAETDSEARELEKELASHINYDVGRRALEGVLNLDLTGVELDDAIPTDRFGEPPALRSRYEIFRTRALDDRASVRDLIIENHRSFGHIWAVGSAATVADKMIDWFEGEACDGFSLNAPFMPGGLERICSLLVPELQNRGYFKSEYRGSTLREHLGLSRPGAWDAAAAHVTPSGDQLP
ncbi:NtaA/DmoA family FMN-dependent monooxygenase [Microbacterium sp. zg.B48]|uniref:NtaA/DmoA family FMN-dependent monooxygenase n=1 Tax=Microbacterium sp. zg.B48 TaxID=2969408 RepID=UPI00214CD53A|nr:NtaA/DmoA family FMN-dependent monooxygenase [Microbacterium sp. zg.B48]MCR2765007.1 NtaA/DmoA family FMN-dependent monooxygenase [Microbacterium sp. zg.B48]